MNRTDDSLDFLLSDAGVRWLEFAAGLPLNERSRLSDLSALRRGLPASLAGAVLEQASLRVRAASKFARGGQMLFTSDGLQQASAEPVAAHRATRFEGCNAADLTCGIGGDALALAASATRLLAFDRDLGRLRMARHNLSVYDRSAFFACADLLALPVPHGEFDTAFCDPGRRSQEGRRIFRPEDYEPPLDALLSAYSTTDLAVKVAPGIDYIGLLTSGSVGEVEVVSLGGDVKEAVLWTRGLAGPGVRRRATLLPSGHSLTDADAPDDCPVTHPQAYLYEPDGAVIRTGLVRPLAHILGLSQLDSRIAYLTGPDPLDTPFARGFLVEEVWPFNLKALNRRLAALGVGTVELKKRGIAIEPEALRPRLRLGGAAQRTVIFTRRATQPLMLICKEI